MNKKSNTDANYNYNSGEKLFASSYTCIIAQETVLRHAKNYPQNLPYKHKESDYPYNQLSSLNHCNHKQQKEYQYSSICPSRSKRHP